MKPPPRPAKPKAATESAETPKRTPGSVLRESLMKPLGISAYRVAKDTGIPQITISQILRNRRSVTPAIAVRLGRYFGMNPHIWLTLQAEVDLAKISPEGPEFSVQRCAALGEKQVVVNAPEAAQAVKRSPQTGAGGIRFGPVQFRTATGKLPVTGSAPGGSAGRPGGAAPRSPTGGE